jgi:hypothetical protein
MPKNENIFLINKVLLSFLLLFTVFATKLSFSLPLFETLRDQTPKQFTLLYLPLNRRWYKLRLGTSTRAFGAIDRDEQCTARTVAHHQTGSR